MFEFISWLLHTADFGFFLAAVCLTILVLIIKIKTNEK